MSEGRYARVEQNIPFIIDKNELEAIKNSKVTDPKLFDSLDHNDESYKLIKLTGSFVDDLTDDFQMSPVANLES